MTDTISPSKGARLALLIGGLVAAAFGIAVLVIEHDMRFIFNLCDRVANTPLNF